MKKLLESIIHTLNKIEVKGKDNMDMLLGCIQALERLRDACHTKTEEITVEGELHEAENEHGE